MMNGKSVYTEEFKQGAVGLVSGQGLGQGEVGRRLGTPSKNINRWVKQPQQGLPKGTSNAPSQDWVVKAGQLEKGNKQLRMGRDTLQAEGFTVGRCQVRRLMKKHTLQARYPERSKTTAQSRHAYLPVFGCTGYGLVGP